ncbi:S41 family peptidase [Geomesophilobacter sediminis]|uniref:S41 family peptidase n=1 Tax=Geomesophilobacter sediminis TaxID=2798584 RepID=A0A8J7IPL2_9BACT|nr:S41 family peptidase [Geomesophilobacter sediminis]MBJ6725538.1 S41 family peptidase [Geomesophilobacter sediminis]
MPDRRPRKWRPLVFALAAVAMSAVVLVLAHNCYSTFTASNEIPPEATPQFALMAEAWNTIRSVYVDRKALNPETMAHGAISGMVDALGDSGHSTFLTKEMIEEEKEFTTGQYKGVGLELRMEKGHAVIVAPLDGSPAQRAGIRSGGVITKVDGKSLIGLNVVQIVKMILGPEGTRVRLTVFDPKSNSTQEFTLTRAAIRINNVRWHQLPGTSLAHLRIAAVSNGVTKALGEALEQIRQQQMTGIVLDLRDDPGGVLDEAIGCTSLFVTQGDALLVKDAAGQVRRVPVRRAPHATRLPVVVLVNEGTGSAAEIMAGAIQDAGRGKLVGEKTFGTGTVLQPFELSDGSALLLAVEEWLTPKGHSIWHKGIAPDVEVVLPETVPPLLPDEEGDLTAAQLKASKDTQLVTGIRLLAGGNR